MLAQGIRGFGLCFFHPPLLNKATVNVFVPEDQMLGQKACAVFTALISGTEIDFPNQSVFTAKPMCHFLHIPASTGFYHFIIVS